MSTINIKLYDILRTEFKLSDVKAKEFTEVIQDIAEQQSKEGYKSYSSGLREDLLKLEMQLKSEIKDSKIDTIKWFIGIFIALALMIIGLYIKK